MIHRVYEQASLSEARTVHVATDDKRIEQEVIGFGGSVIMTSANHATGTDRIFEAAKTIGLSSSDIVVNVQGDEPLIPPGAINEVASLIDGSVEMATLRERITRLSDVFSPNVVKVVTDENDCALLFSRAPIPWSRASFPDNLPTQTQQLAKSQLTEPSSTKACWFRHLGIYAYTVSMLERYIAWEPTALEQLESLEQLRVLSNGEQIRVKLTDEAIPPGIDVPEDIARTLAVLSEGTEP